MRERKQGVGGGGVAKKAGSMSYILGELGSILDLCLFMPSQNHGWSG